MNHKEHSEERLSTAIRLKLILLCSLVLVLLAVGLSGARKSERLLHESSGAKESAEGAERRIPDLKAPAEGGSFTLSKLRLIKAGGSTKLKGDISNDTGQRWHSAAFELKAFDEKGHQLKGTEDITIFQVNDFDEAAIEPLGGEYGVWLQGIPFESISKVEAILVDGRLPATYKFALESPAREGDLIFEDEAVRIGFDVHNDGIKFVLLKKTDLPVEIDWSKAGFIDPSGEQHALEHLDVSLSHGLGASISRIALPEAAAVGTLVPRDLGSTGGAGNVSPLLPEGPAAFDYKGKSITLVVPVNINGLQKSYNIDFKITDVGIKRFYLQDERYRFLYDPARPNEFDMDE